MGEAVPTPQPACLHPTQDDDPDSEGVQWIERYDGSWFEWCMTCSTFLRELPPHEVEAHRRG